MIIFTTIDDVSDYLSEHILNGFETDAERELINDRNATARLFSSCDIAYDEPLERDDHRLATLINSALEMIFSEANS